MTLRPVGSPIIPVKSPITKMMWWPRSCSCRSLLNWTVWPRCRSGRVGSKPSLIRSGLPRASFAASSDSTSSSSAPRRKTASWCGDVDGHGGGAAFSWRTSAARPRSVPRMAARGRPRAFRATFARIATLPARLPAMITHKSTILAQSVRAVRAAIRAGAHGRAVACRRAVRHLRRRGVRPRGQHGARVDAHPRDPARPPAARGLGRRGRRRPGYWREDRIRRGDTIGSVLARLGVDDPAALEFLRTNPSARPLVPAAPGQAAVRRDRRRRPAHQPALRDRRRRAPVDRARRRAARGADRRRRRRKSGGRWRPAKSARRCSAPPTRRACPTR